MALIYVRDNQQRRERALAALESVGILDRASHLPNELSRGQQQRVALARAFAIEPKILLLDEPFSALDKNLRLDMQIEVKGLLKQYGITSILVTHDQEEALSMADRIVVLNQGQVEQTDIPTRIYDSPASLFVNRFVGHTNLVAGKVTKAAGPTCTVQLNCGPTLNLRAPNGIGTGANVLVSIRPENLRVAAAPGPYTILATARLNLPLGPADVLEAVTGDGLGIELTCPHQRQSEVIGPGAVVHLEIVDFEACSLFPDSTAVHH